MEFCHRQNSYRALCNIVENRLILTLSRISFSTNRTYSQTIDGQSFSVLDEVSKYKPVIQYTAFGYRVGEKKLTLLIRDNLAWNLIILTYILNYNVFLSKIMFSSSCNYCVLVFPAYMRYQQICKQSKLAKCVSHTSTSHQKWFVWH